MFTVSTAAFCQSTDTLNVKTRPKDGLAAVAVVYFKIDFSREELDYLRTHEAELIFTIDDNGKAKLEKVNGIEIPSIIDSMKRVDDRLPGFFPEIVDGKPATALFFMKILWPQYEPMIVAPGSSGYKYLKRKLDEFEFIEYYGPRIDMSMGGVASMFGGSANRYNHGGGGMKIDVMFFGKRGWGGGMTLSFHGNRMREAYPLSATLPQSPSRVFGFFGLGIGKVFKEMSSGSHFILQFEPTVAIHNIITIDQHVSKDDAVQAFGFSPGIGMNYLLSLGKGRMTFYHGQLSTVRHGINFHVIARPMFYDISEASGVMIEAGISYRLMFRQVSDCKLKNPN